MSGVPRPTTRLRRGRGLASVELAIIVPGILVLIFATIQLSIWYHALNTAEGAAAACAERARGYDSSAAEGKLTGYRVLSQVKGLNNPEVRTSETPREVTCTVTGTVPALILLDATKVEKSVTMPKERIA